MKLSPISRIACLLVSPVVLTVIAATYSENQHPILDQVANKVIQKYQTSSYRNRHRCGMKRRSHHTNEFDCG